jgi:hypothetical protein
MEATVAASLGRSEATELDVHEPSVKVKTIPSR